MILWDEVARNGGSSCLGQMSINSMALPPIIAYASNELKSLIVKDVIAGKKVSFGRNVKRGSKPPRRTRMHLTERDLRRTLRSRSPSRARARTWRVSAPGQREVQMDRTSLSTARRSGSPVVSLEPSKRNQEPSSGEETHKEIAWSLALARCRASLRVRATGNMADYFTMLTKTETGLTVFLVPRHSPGLNVRVMPTQFDTSQGTTWVSSKARGNPNCKRSRHSQ